MTTKTPETPLPWVVKRHGGFVAPGEWRVVAAGDEESCRERFLQIARDLRQGTVDLYNPDGALCLRKSAP